MTLPGKIQSAPCGVKGFDTDTPLSFETAEQFFSDGYRFCLRYLSRTTPGKLDLSHDEACAILKARLALMAVQHVCGPGWEPTEALGATYGANAVINAHAVGLPPGLNIWCDLEGVKKPGDVEKTKDVKKSVVDYCNAWYKVVAEAGYVPGIYVGYDTFLSGNDLYHKLWFQHYWKSWGNVPDVSVRGYQLIQSKETLVNGMEIDKNTTQKDHKGGQAQWLIDDERTAT